MVKRADFIHYLNNFLNCDKFKDYAPNGLQVEGRDDISKIVSGVTASQALVDQAIEKNADAIFVHHGYFWKLEDPTLTGMKKRRIKALLNNDVNLFAYHLPLDAHPEVGNNVQLARVLGLEITGEIDMGREPSIVFAAKLPKPMPGENFAALIENNLGRKPLHIAGLGKDISSIAICTGGAQDYIDMAVAGGFDAFITGEVSERTVHTARECGIDFFAAGHHATERYGIQALCEHLAEQFNLQHEFIDCDNPV